MKPGEGFQASDQAKPHHINITPPRFARVQDTFVKFSIRGGGEVGKILQTNSASSCVLHQHPSHPPLRQGADNFHLHFGLGGREVLRNLADPIGYVHRVLSWEPSKFRPPIV